MRVFFSVMVLEVVLVLLLAGCSSGDEVTIRRGSPSAPSQAQTSTNGNDPAPAANAPSSAPASSPSSSSAPDAATTPPPPSTPAVPGSCASPKCFGLGGLGGCKATNRDGALVTMGCQDGACACLVGNQTTSTFDGNVASADDAKQLFFTNCACF